MKIPASVNGETVYVVGFDLRNPPSAVVVQSDGCFATVPLGDLTVLPYAEDEFIPTSFVPPATLAD